MMSNTPSFEIEYSDTVPELLFKLNINLAVSTYQASKLMLIGLASQTRLLQVPKHIPKPMGVAVNGDVLAVAGFNDVSVYRNTRQLTATYPKNPGVFDSMYMPRATYYTGQIDAHDMEWGTDGLWAVNTSFSCLSLIDANFAFKPKWKPSFISELLPEDRCHLNGMAMKGGRPKYVTCLGKSNEKQGWRKKENRNGLVIDVDTQEVLLEGLVMPHSPRVCADGNLYVLESGTGSILKIDVKTNVVESYDLPGFSRGMSEYGGYLFIGMSEIRETSTVFKDMPSRSKENRAGVLIVYLPTMAVVGALYYKDTVKEIFDVQVIPQSRRTNLLTPQNAIHRDAICAEDLNFWKKRTEPIE